MELTRRKIFSFVGTTGVGSVDFGVFEVGQYSRLSGIVKADSLTNSTGVLTFRSQVKSGVTILTSGVAVFSGGNAFEVQNHGMLVSLAITPVQSATPYSIVIFGEPNR